MDFMVFVIRAPSKPSIVFSSAVSLTRPFGDQVLGAYFEQFNYWRSRMYTKQGSG